MQKININAFLKQFNKEYDFLYNARGDVAGYDEAVDFFDEFLKNHSDFVGEFAMLRGDMITSDREAAAFSFALVAMGAI